MNFGAADNLVVFVGVKDESERLKMWIVCSKRELDCGCTRATLNF